jgi:hypothetical protein
MCELDFSGSDEGLVPKSCESGKQQFDFMKYMECLDYLSDFLNFQHESCSMK